MIIYCCFRRNLRISLFIAEQRKKSADCKKIFPAFYRSSDFMEQMKWIVLSVAVIMYVLVIVFQKKKVWFTTGAAVLIVITGCIFPGAIFSLPETSSSSKLFLHTYALTHTAFEIINWNVILIYLGSMIIAALFIYSKVPARIADAIVASFKNTGLAMTAILVMTGIISMFVENVATVLVMAPVALAMCRKLEINPATFMIGLAVMSNLEGTATLVGDPPSMIFASYAGYTFIDFFFHQGKFSIFWIVQAGLLTGCIYFFIRFSSCGKNSLRPKKTQVVSYVPLWLLLAMIFGLAALSFIPNCPPFSGGIFVLATGLFGLVWYCFRKKDADASAISLVKELDWETIFFLPGIFTVIGAIQETGLLNDFAQVLSGITGGSKLAGFIMIIAVSVIISGFVDNVPYIMAMLPVVREMVLSMNASPELFMFALLTGSCLGGNLTPFGASANIVAMGIVRKQGYEMKFSKWLTTGVPFTILTTAAAAAVLWLIWA